MEAKLIGGQAAIVYEGERSMRKRAENNAWIILGLTLILTVFFLAVDIRMMDDGFLYEEFAEKIVEEGVVDFSIPGFHGLSFLGAAVYLLTGSHHSINFVAILCSVLTVPVIYLVTREVWDSEAALVAAFIFMLSPFFYVTPLRGFTFSGQNFFMLLAMYLIMRDSRWAFAPFGLACLVKPYALSMIPLFVFKKKWRSLLMGLAIPVIYVVVQYLQIGGIWIGVHRDLSASTVFSLIRFPIEVMHTISFIFSVHDYNPVNPAYVGRLFHVTPIVTFFAMANLLYPKLHFKSKVMFFGLALSIFMAFILPALVVVGGTADPFSLEPLALFFIMISSITFARYRRYFWLVIVLSSFQFFYCYLWGRGSWWSASNPVIFLLYFVVSGIAFVYTKDELLATTRELVKSAQEVFSEATNRN